MQFMVNVVDDDSAVAEVLVSLFERHGFHYQLFTSAEQFASSQTTEIPSITFFSSGLTGEGMQQVFGKLRTENMALAIIMTSPGVAASRVAQAMKAGAEDVLEKPFSADQVLTLVKRFLSSPTLFVHRGHDLPTKIVDPLTFEEQQILSLMEQGVAIKQIAAKMDISVRTIHYRKASILAKTNCKNCTEVIAKFSAMRSQDSGPFDVRTTNLFYPGGTIPGGEVGLTID